MTMWPVILAALLAAPVTGHGRAGFAAHGPAGMKIEGASEALTATVADDLLVLSLPLDSLRTGIDLRDRHLREDLQADRFPSVELRVHRSVLKAPAPGAEVSADAQGDLTLHGQTRPVTVHYRAVQKAGTDVTGTARINLKDFGVQVRTYLGITVKPEVDLDVAFHLGS